MKSLTKSKIQIVALVIAAIVIIAALTVAGFWVKRTVNYSWFYKSAVEKHVEQILQQRIASECFITEE